MVSTLGKPIAFHAVHRHYRPSRAYWIEQVIGAWLIVFGCTALFVAFALLISLATTNETSIVGVAFGLTLPFMFAAHYALYRHSYRAERRRMGLEVPKLWVFMIRAFLSSCPARRVIHTGLT